jgi:myo-inositol 2-dehydrogenase/D-chiro-inositol 1-dehydrogenase
MIRVGFLGCAHVHAATYFDELSALGAESGWSVAVYDRDAQRGRAFATARGLTFAETPEELCELVDAAIITSEHVHFPELVRVAAAAAVPVLCEKPLGISETSAEAILNSGAWLSVAFPVRYAHPVRQAKALIDTGELGSLVAMSGMNRAPVPAGFFTDRASSGGGAIIDHVVHVADALRWLVGCEFRTVYAEAGRFRNVGDVDDIAQVVATTQDGAWATIDSSWSRLPGIPGAIDFEMTLWFEHGHLTLDAFARRAELAREAAVEDQPYGWSMDAGMLHDWLRAIQLDAPPPVPMVDGWKATQLALAALRSAEEEEIVQIPL